MKKLRKVSNTKVNSIEAYACACGTRCTCVTGCDCGLLFFTTSNTKQQLMNNSEANTFSDAKSNNYKK